MKKYFLTLFKNQYKKNFNKFPIYYLGVWCTPLTQIDANDKCTLSNPIENERFQKNSSNYFTKVKKKISPHVYKKLNEIHKTNYSYEYWDFILGFYIEVVIGLVYQKWILLQKIKKNKKKKFITNLYKINREAIALNSTSEFYNKILNNGETIQHYIDTVIIENSKICEYKKIKKYLNPRRLQIKKNRNSKLEFLYKLSNFYLKLSKSAENIFLSPINPRFILKSFLKKKKLPIYLKDPNLNYKYNKNLRDWNLKINSKNYFENTVIKILSNILPRSVLEGYSTNKQLIKKKYNFKSKNLFFAIGVSDLFNTLMIEKKLEGARLINIQHGGNYGTIRRYLDECYELNNADYFLSYGFGRENLNYKISSKIIKLGPINFEKKLGPTREKKKFLFILPHFIFRYVQMNTYPWTKQKFDHLNEITNLFNTLDNEIKKISEIRFHPFDKDVILNYMKKNISDFKHYKIYNKTKIDFEKYNLVISLYPGTSMLQSLYKNLPTIISFPTKYFKLKKIIKKNFNKLKQNNIFFEDTSKLVNFLNNSELNPNKWWYSKKIQSETKKFIKLFCINVNQEKKIQKFLSEIN